MANKLMLTATFLALLFLASAFSYRTTFEINEDTDPERREQQRRGAGGSSEGCHSRMQAQQLQSCKQYLRGAGGKGAEGYIVLPTRRKEEGGGKQGQQEQQKRQQQQLQQCCQQLRQIEEQCRCEALKQIVREEQQQPTQPSQPGQGQRQEQVRQVQQRASGLLATCGLGSQRCEISTRVPGLRTGFW